MHGLKESVSSVESMVILLAIVPITVATQSKLMCLFRVERWRSRSVYSRASHSTEPWNPLPSGFSEHSRVIAAWLNVKWNNFFSPDSTYHPCIPTNSYSVLQCSGCNPTRLASLSPTSFILPMPPPTPPCTPPTHMSNLFHVLSSHDNEPISPQSQETKERTKLQWTQEWKVCFENTETWNNFQWHFKGHMAPAGSIYWVAQRLLEETPIKQLAFSSYG